MAESSVSPQRPVDLGPAGRALWDSIVPAYQLRPDELRVLEDACRLADMIAALENQVDLGQLFVDSPQGQRINPGVDTLRRYRATMGTLLRQLKLPDAPGQAARSSDASDQARKAARARWDRRTS